MIVKQLMQKELVTCNPSDSVHDAAAKMKDYGVGAVLIVDEGMNLRGILTDRDIALSVVGDSKDPRTAIVSDIMTPNPTSISSDIDIESALKTMSSENVRRLPVTQDGRVIGLLSTSDLATEIKEEFDQFLSLEQAFAKQH
ncbi:MAG: hypothetical protein A2010_06680 [Nitrospirae bacterium GWD2_57_9]|nr:MAG: hypothetical protein A2010_06680 [Nitrospirae bacterium GWD2_57_9]OGW45048.1 MAG: hypothetical protein A2078_10470 [Nitrospirae bacterium GWC2_57_9]